MSRNAESRFAVNPTRIDMQRSRLPFNFSVKTSFNAGDIIPCFCTEILPGDTFNVKTSKVVRLQTLLTPVMDNIYLDTYFFFVPNRLVWDHWKEFCGENTESAWIPETEYEIPQVTAPEGGWQTGTIADYFGVPTGVSNLSISALPFRAYSLICNEWFRSEALSDPVLVPKDDSTLAGSNGNNPIEDLAKGGKPYVAAKFHDFYTSALPAPQAGPAVSINVAGEGLFPVVTSKETHANNGIGLLHQKAYGDNSSTYYVTGRYGESGSMNWSTTAYTEPSGSWSGTYPNAVVPVNLYADVSSGSAVTVNDLRLAFQMQKFYESLARGGQRYTEILRSMFGVTSPDARLQRPEYLGGNRVPVNINQVIQQSATGSGSTPQGTTVGVSLTTDNHAEFIKSFTEHGHIIGVMVARYDHTYQQGLKRMWSRKSRFDFYWPTFANIGEQAIKNKEIYAQGTAEDDEVFGYQEAWAEYRYAPSYCTGSMRSTAPYSLDVWHLGDDYSELPRLSDEWIREDKNTIDRVLAVTSEEADQFFADIYYHGTATRPMPVYSIPGLIDHH